jgi:hypothetical protein
MMLCDLCGKVAECIKKEIGGQELNVCEDCPVMNFTAEQIRIAAMIDSKVQALSGVGCDDATIMREMLDYNMPEFKRLLNTSQQGEMDELCRRLPWFYRYTRIESLCCRN